MIDKASLFDRFAAACSRQVAHAWFFCLCVLLVVVWVPSFFVIQSVDTWQLIINTMTTIITFLLVALLQNDQQRFEDSTNEKLDAQTKALAFFAEHNQSVWNEVASELRKTLGDHTEQ